MSRQLKLILFVLVFNAIGFAEGYLLSDSGFVWVLPIIVATACGAVLLSRQLLEATSCEDNRSCLPLLSVSADPVLAPRQPVIA